MRAVRGFESLYADLGVLAMLSKIVAILYIQTGYPFSSTGLNFQIFLSALPPLGK